MSIMSTLLICENFDYAKWVSYLWPLEYIILVRNEAYIIHILYILYKVQAAASINKHLADSHSRVQLPEFIFDSLSCS